VELDGRSMQGWTVAEARNALRGPLGTSVKIVVERGQGTRIPVTLERADIRVSAVARPTVLAGGVGYLAVTNFSDSTEVELTATLDSLRRAGARALILDLRGNPGGLLSQGVSVSDSNASYLDETAERYGAMPVVVLVNGNTASAAEIVAGALQDHDRALVMGRVTYGKGSAQAVYPLDNGAALMLTHARWYTPLGRSLEVARPGEIPLVDVDTARPVFRTASGRAVLGGGGIVPDLIAGDSAPDPAERRFFAQLGADVPRWREALTAQARALVREGAIRDTAFTMRPEWRLRVRGQLDRMGLHVTRSTFAEVSELIDRSLGAEIARQAFGIPFALRRQVRTDPVVQRAAELLRRARNPADVFAVE
jgi:carboxyl-terminal processing protease